LIFGFIPDLYVIKRLIRFETIMTASKDHTKKVDEVLLAGNRSAEANNIITKVEAWRVSLFFNII